MKPYYEHGGVTIYHGDARDVLPLLGPRDWGLVLTDPPYSTGRSEAEFCASGNVACILDAASRLAPSLAVFSTSSGRGFEFVRSSVRALPHCRTLTWARTYTNSPAAGPWRWDTVFIHVFGKGAFGRPERSSLIVTDGTQALAKETGHKAPVPVAVMRHVADPFMPGLLLDPFCGSGASLLAAAAAGGTAVGIEINEAYCEIAAKRLAQEVMPL